MSAFPGLKEQFRLMQEQQKDRYVSRKALSSTSQSRFDNETTGSVLKELPSEDDLGLRTHFESKPEPSPERSAVRCPVEVSFLQKEIERLQLQTTELNVAVAQKTREVSEMRSKMEEEKEALGGVGSKATQRIVELSRRNRELMSELAVEKNRVRQLQRELQEAVSKLAVRIDEQVKEPPPVMVKAAEPNDKLTVARLQDELLEAKHKSTDYSNQCQQLKMELKLAHKAILKEVGDGASLQAILGGTSGWRGRAQQIVALQNKVAELKQQLQSRAPSAVNDGQLAEMREKGRPEERQKAAIRKMEEERKKSLDETRSELQNLHELYSKCQQQNTALKARNKTLTTDAKALKAQVANLLEKEAIDKVLIQKSMTETCQGHNGITMQPSGKLEEANKALQMQLDTCLAELKTLRKRVPQFREESCDGEQSTSRCSTRMKVEASHSDGSTSLPPIKLPRGTRGIASVRKSISAGHHPLWPAGDIDTQELQALLQVSGVEKDRLLELSTVLQERLDASSDRCMKLDTELRACKQRITELERQIARQPTGKCGKPSGMLNNGDDGEVAKLRSQLSVQLDENCVLKETLALTRHEKMEDMRMLHSLLQETKVMFIESIKVLCENTRNQCEN